MNRLDGMRRAVARVLGNRDVRNVQAAGLGSVLGTYAYGVALPVYAYRAGGALAVSLLFLARFLLAALAAPWLGVLVDRWSRRRMMVTADLTRCGIFVGVTAAAIAGESPYLIYVLAIASTIISSGYTPAQAALLPSLVSSPEELTSANLVANTAASVGMFAGPAIGGILLALSGTSAVFALNAGAYLWSFAFVVRVPRDAPPKRTERPRFLAELVEGFTTVLKRPALRVIVGLTAAQSIVEGALEVLLVVLAIRMLHAGNAGLGWLNTAMGIGSIVGAAVVAVIAARRRLAGGFALGILLWGVPIAVAAAATTLPLGLVLIGFVGVAVIVVQVTGITLLQRSAENEVIGRVFAVLQSLILGSMAVGTLAGYGLVSWLGPRGAFIATGAFLPVLLVPQWPALRRIDAAGVVAEEPLRILRSIEIFAQLPEAVLERLASGAALVTANAGEAVVTRGDAGNLFYAIADGRATVELEDEPSRELGPGDSFGEIALLRDVPRTATVRAVDELRLYAIARDDFLAAVTGHAPTLEAAESVVTSRLPAALLG